jgi:hypothetical protein
MEDGSYILSPQYRAAARVALLTQLPVATLSLLVLDSGWTAKICAGVMIGFWLAAALIATRRPWTPSAGDLLFWRWGFVPCFLIAWTVAAIVQKPA